MYWIAEPLHRRAQDSRRQAQDNPKTAQNSQRLGRDRPKKGREKGAASEDPESLALNALASLSLPQSSRLQWGGRGGAWRKMRVAEEDGEVSATRRTEKAGTGVVGKRT